MRKIRIIVTLCVLLLSIHTTNAQQMLIFANDSIAGNDGYVINNGEATADSTQFYGSCIVRFNEKLWEQLTGDNPSWTIGVCYSSESDSPTLQNSSYKLGEKKDKLSSIWTFHIAVNPGTTYYYRVYVISGWDNAVHYGDVVKVTTLGTPPADNSKMINGHKFVDLGLPSGLLWAEKNIGANTLADIGDLFAWGETSARTGSSKTYVEDYKFDETSGYAKYNETDGKTELDQEDDAAFANWGAPCRMPTASEIQELRNNCVWSWQWNTNTGFYVLKITSKKNGNKIFFTGSNTWSKSLYGMTYGYSTVVCVVRTSKDTKIDYAARQTLCPIRPVAKP